MRQNARNRKILVLGLLVLGALCGLAGPATADTSVLECPGVGTGGDLADLRGVRFIVDRDFSALELRFQGSVAGRYQFDVELRRSRGFVVTPERVVTGIAFTATGGISAPPYVPVRIPLPSPVAVGGATSFTLKFTNVSSPAVNASLYFEVGGGAACPNVEETEQNDVAVPTVRGNVVRGFRVLRPGISIASTFVATPPVIDGAVGFGEWPGGGQLTLGHGFARFVNDANRLYVLLDVLGDNGNDPGDYFWLTADVDRDGAIDANFDLNYAPAPPTQNLRYQFYVGPSVWTPLQPETFSSRGRGFGCFFGDGTRGFGFLPNPGFCNSHRVWELALDLRELGATPGGRARLGLRVASGSPAFTDEVPAGFSASFADLFEVALAPASESLPAPSGLASVHLDTDPIEVTQAIQTRNNSLPLVQDKKTVARVYVDVDLVATRQPAQAFLYGTRGGIDLPGSPLLQSVAAPATIDRTKLGDTANFELPATWPQGTVGFRAKSRSRFDQVSTSGVVSLGFTPKARPTYWVVPVNSGTVASPSVPSDTEIADQQRYTQAVYPLSGINWVRKPWQVLGVVTASEPIPNLNAYYNTTALAWVLGLIFGGAPPFTLPDQIYGFTSSGGGNSDPVWIGAAGRVARGFRGTSREGTLAHEIEHNLDRSTNGTWGRHTPFGCGAAGPNPVWPFANDDIQEVGFDTSLPWVDGSGSRRTVIPANFPDFMSYCQSGTLPTKWISTYRWQNLFSNFASPAAASSAPESAAAAAAAVTNVFYVSGQVNVNGTGGLAPVLTQPGIPSDPIAPGDYAIELLDARGGALLRQPFLVQFEDVEGNPVDVVAFSLLLPAVQGVRTVRLLLKTNVLDEIQVSNIQPTVVVQRPNGGERWAGGPQLVEWTAGHAGGNPLFFTILFTPDGGKNWAPVVSGLPGGPAPTPRRFEHVVDPSLLPPGSDARIRVIVSDGFNTASDDSDRGFVLEPSAPLVQIDEPANGAKLPLGESVPLRGSATDPQPGPLPDDAFAWSEGQTQLGVGPELHVALPLGPHTITLAVTNDAGKIGTSSVSLEILPPPDADGDGVPDAQDNCRFTPNADQSDLGGIGANAPPDGVGDACQCGDVNGDGRVTLVDSTSMQRSLLVPPTAVLARPDLCEVSGDGRCTLADAATLRRALLNPPTASIQQSCGPAVP